MRPQPKLTRHIYPLRVLAGTRLLFSRYIFINHTQADQRMVVAVFIPEQKRAAVIVVDPYR